MKTALRAKVFRREVSSSDLSVALKQIEADVEKGIWLRIDPPFAEVLRLAEEFSDRYVADLGCRTLDIMHVAVASILRADCFLTFDVRQSALAKRAGLVVRPE